MCYHQLLYVNEKSKKKIAQNLPQIKKGKEEEEEDGVWPKLITIEIIMYTYCQSVMTFCSRLKVLAQIRQLISTTTTTTTAKISNGTWFQYMQFNIVIQCKW